MKIGILTLIVLLSCEQSNPIEGSWKMEEIHYIYTDTTYSTLNAKIGRFVYSDNRYVIMYNPWTRERIPFDTLSKPRDEEIIASFKTIVYNSGSYTQTDSTLTTIADIAKVPGFEGGKQYYRYTLSEDKLDITMFDETYPNGDKPTWFGKMKVRFVLKRE